MFQRTYRPLEGKTIAASHAVFVSLPSFRTCGLLAAIRTFKQPRGRCYRLSSDFWTVEVYRSLLGSRGPVAQVVRAHALISVKGRKFSLFSATSKPVPAGYAGAALAANAGLGPLAQLARAPEFAFRRSGGFDPLRLHHPRLIRDEKKFSTVSGLLGSARYLSCRRIRIILAGAPLVGDAVTASAAINRPPQPNALVW